MGILKTTKGQPPAKIVGEASLDAFNIMLEGLIRNLLYNPLLFRY